MAEDRKAVRARNRLLRQCILEILKDTWPQPWSTPELRLAFRGQEYAKVYPQLMGLETAKLARAFPAGGRLWWVYVGDQQWPRCGLCQHRAESLVLIEYYERRGGWACELADHRLAVAQRDWPWPSGPDLLLVRDQ